jgi:transposase-like protein
MSATNRIERERTPVALMLYGLYIYYASRSLRLASKILEPVIERSHVSIWHWIQRFASVSDRFSVDRRDVKRIFVDETLVTIKGREYWLWIAYEPSLDRCLMMRLSVERTLMICYLFLKDVTRRYGRKPILTDEARWYDEACRWLRLEASQLSCPGEEPHRTIHSGDQGQDRMLRRLVPVSEGGVRQISCMELAQDVHPSHTS